MKRKFNKSQLIRDFHLANPAAKPREIAAALKDQKVKVSNLYVSLILSKLRSQGVTPVSQQAQVAPVVKRGPGRPKSIVTAPVAVAPVVKRGPGRPKSVVTAPVAAAPVVKRGPGRPKSVVAAPVAAAPAKRGRKPKQENMATLVAGIRAAEQNLVKLIQLAEKLGQQVA